MNFFVFKIGTVPDIDGCRGLYDLHGLSDDDVARAVFHQCRQRSHNEVLPHHLQRIVMISAALRHGEQFRVWSLGGDDSDEAELLRRLFGGIDRYAPSLVSWQGGRFDLPVIHYRSLLYSIDAAAYWQTFEKDGPKHIDLSAILSRNSLAEMPLGEVAGLCGFPASAGLTRGETWERYLEDDLQSIRRGGETEVLNTYLIYLNFLLNCGQLDTDRHRREVQLVRQSLQNSDADYLRAFEKAWVEI